LELIANEVLRRCGDAWVRSRNMQGTVVYSSCSTCRTASGPNARYAIHTQQQYLYSDRYTALSAMRLYSDRCTVLSAMVLFTLRISELQAMLAMLLLEVLGTHAVAIML
jgi:hypothetical protein